MIEKFSRYKSLDKLDIPKELFNNLNNALEEKSTEFKKILDDTSGATSKEVDGWALAGYRDGLRNMAEYIVTNYTLTKK
jgi:hypothetical protein